ncbi:MAG TPA: hypothetical protein DCS93_39185 [Microscillaceae bacterium]|nr:hypothetical protein [Microscillaceae bacterium]
MKKVATSIKATLVVLALGLLSIQAERLGYFDNLSLKSWISSSSKDPEKKKVTTQQQLTPDNQKTPASLVSSSFQTPTLKKDFFMGGLAEPYLKDGKPCDCIQTTSEGKNQRGRVFSYEKLNLRQDFALELDFYFGTRTTEGADGQILIIHNDPRGNDAEGDYGEGLGYGSGRGSQGIAPSMAVEMDTWKNGNRQDPDEDHIAYLENGNVTHNDPGLPLVKMPEMEDGKEHRLRFEWYASAKKIKVFFDKDGNKEIDPNTELLFEVNKDLVDLLGTASPYWGISGATGSRYNLQYFCNPHGKLVFTPTEFCATYEGLEDKSSVEGLGKVHPMLNITTSKGKARVLYEDGKQSVYTAPNDKNAPNGKTKNGCIGNGRGFADTDSQKKRLHDYVFTFENNAAVKNFSMQMLDFGDYNAAKANVQSVILVGYNANGDVVDTDSLIVTKTSHGNLKLTGDACSAQPGEPGNYTFNIVGDGITKVKVLYYNDGTNQYGGNRPSDPNIAIGNICFKMDANGHPNPPADKPECKAYAVNNDQGNSQFYTIDLNNYDFILPLGDVQNGADIQGVELHPVHGTLYAVSGGNATSNKGYLYRVNTETGAMTAVGATGYDNITSLAFNRIDNHLWAWANGAGLVQINLNTGKATLQAASNYQVSGLAWDKDGDQLYAASGSKLFAFNPGNQQITEVSHNLPGETSALEVRPDGLLMGAVSRSGAMTTFVYDLRTFQVVKTERLTTTYNKISAVAWADWCDINDNIVIPAENCVVFNNVTPGTVVEGMGVLHPLLDIKTSGGAAKILVEGGADKIYITPKGSNGSMDDDINTDTKGRIINGCIGAGFADTRPIKDRLHDYAFNFKPGTKVSSFSLKMVDYGDWNPSKATNHSVALVAYDASGNVIDKHELKHTTQAGKTLGKAGDACNSKEGESGKYTFTVKGQGIAQVKLEFENNGSKYGGKRSSDPNIAINKVCFIVDQDQNPPVIPCDVSVYYANHTNNQVSTIYTAQTDLVNKTVTFKEFTKLPFGDAHIALSLDGKRLYAVKGFGNNELGYVNMEDKSYHTVGYLNIGKVTQLAFAPNGKLYFSETNKNEVYVIDNIDATLYTKLGKINLNNGFLDISGGDIIFGQDGTFYEATSASGGRIYRVSNQGGLLTAEEIGSSPRNQINGIAVLDHGNGSLVYAGKGKKGFTVLDPNTGSSYELAAKGDLDVLGYGDLSSSCMDLVIDTPDPDKDPLACDKIKITNAGNDVTINNENDQEVVVYYSVQENGQETKIGNLMVDANTSINFSEKVPNNGKIVFSMGSDNIQDSTVVTGAYCAVKTGTKIVDAGERVETIQVYEGKSYDARDLAWFDFKERQELKDLNGNTVEESDKGVSLDDLSTISDETNLKVDFKTGRIGYTNTIVWFKIAGGMPTAPQVLANSLTNGATATGTVNGTIPAGTKMGFLLVGAYAPNNPLAANPGAQLRFQGTDLEYSTDNGATWKTVSKDRMVYTIAAWNKSGKQGVVAGISPKADNPDEKVLTVVFEDIASGGDRDFEDVHCTVFMKGVTKLKTKIIKETKEVDVYTEIPCGNCETTIVGEGDGGGDLECPDDAYRNVLSNAVSDDAHNGNHDHSIWMPNLFVQGQTAIFTFDKDAYMDIKKDDTEAHIYGYATVTKGGGASMGARYLVDVKFTRATGMMPKKELKPGYQTDEVTKDWKFFEMDEANATMTNASTGQVIKLTHKPADKKMGLQVGLTANGKNVKYGASAWFFWEEVGTGRKGHGDFNLDLENLCPGNPLPDLCEPPIEVIYVLDISGSMKWEYPKTDADGKTISRFRAAQNALNFANNALSKQGVQSRAALVTFGRGKTSQIVSGFTEDYQKLNEIVENLGAPNGYTPMPRGMRDAKELLKTRNPDKLPVIILLTDGVPNIDLEGKTYSAKQAEKIDIYNEATQTFRSKEEVAQMGGANANNPGSFHGQPLSEVMGLMEDMKAEVSDLLIYGLGVQKDLTTNKGEFNDDILEYGAHITGALYHTVDNADEMVKAMADILLDATCKPHNPPKDPTCEILLNGTPLTDSTQWNSVWNGQNDTVTVTVKNIKEPVTYTWKLTFPTDPSVPAVEASGTFDQDGTYQIVIPIPPKGQWGNVSSDGTGIFKANVSLNITTPCGDQNWEHIYYAPDEADLQVEKIVDKDSVMVGDTINYTITVTNNGPRTAGDDADTSKAVKLTDVLPSGLNVVSVTGGTFTPAGVMYLGEMNIYTSKTVTIQAVTTTAGTVTNTATVSVASPTDPDLGNNTSSATTQVIAKKADLQITGAGPATAFQGSEATYTFTVTNNGPNDAEQINIVNTLPTGMTLVSSTEGAITSLATGASATFEVKVTLDVTGDLEITSTVSNNIEDPNLANNVASVTTKVIAEPKADLQITGTGPATAAQGAEVTYNFTVTNNGPDNAEQISITNGLPTGMTLVSSTESAITNLATGASATFEVKVTLDVTGDLQITSTVSNNIEDPNPANNVASVTTTVTVDYSNESCFPVFADRYLPGFNKAGQGVFGNAFAAIGQPERTNAVGTYVSLGFGGEITLIYGAPIANGDGNDIRIAEASPDGSTCDNNPEKAEVFASVDGFNWVPLGVACGPNSEFDLGALNQAAFIRIIDVSDANSFTDGAADGFDVDGIACLNGTNPTGPTPTLTPCVGGSLVSFTAGTKQDGSALDAGNDPNQALGDATDPNDPTKSVSLGFGGEIVIKFDYALFNSSGDDISLVEYSPESDCNANKEQVRVFASKFGNEWVLLGEGCMDANYDLGSLNWAQYFRVVDISNPSDFTDANANGFDLDAIKCNGGGGAIFFEAPPVDIDDSDISVSPNPATDHVNVDVAQLFVDSKHIEIQSVVITLTDISGKNLGTQKLDVNNNLNRIVRFNLIQKGNTRIAIINAQVTYKDSTGNQKEATVTKKLIVGN